MLWTIALGIIDRFAPEDVGLIVIESSTSRRRALSGTDRAVTVRATDRADDVSITLDEVQAELDHHAGIDSSSRDRASRLVVVIGDIGHVRLRLTGQLRSRFDDVLAAAARSDSGVDVIAYASDLAGAGPFGEHVAQCIVGASSDSTELAALGVDDPAELEGIVGRCRWFPEGALVQLASAEVPVENLLARRSPGGGP